MQARRPSLAAAPATFRDDRTGHSALQLSRRRASCEPCGSTQSWGAAPLQAGCPQLHEHIDRPSRLWPSELRSFGDSPEGRRGSDAALERTSIREGGGGASRSGRGLPKPELCGRISGEPQTPNTDGEHAEGPRVLPLFAAPLPSVHDAGLCIWRRAKTLEDVDQVLAMRCQGFPVHGGSASILGEVLHGEGLQGRLQWLLTYT